MRGDFNIPMFAALAAFGLAAAGPTATASAPSPPPNLPQASARALPPAPRPAPDYVVVEGSHTEDAAPRQQLTVTCPATHAALGAGFAAVARDPKTQANIQAGLDSVRSVPDSAGHGWQVEGTADKGLAGRPWRLVVRVTCLRMVR